MIHLTVSGIGIHSRKSNSITTSSLEYIEVEISIEDSKEFGKFVGSPRSIAKSISKRKNNINIPTKYEKTWTITEIDGGSEELFVNWANEFEKFSADGVDQEDILVCWLQFTNSKYIRYAIQNYIF